MKRSRRIFFGTVGLFLFVFICLIFRNFLYRTLLMPLALTLWFMLRLLAFGIHQAVLWYLVIGVVCLYFLFRYLRTEPVAFPADPYLSENLHIKKLRSLNTLMRLCGKGEPYRENIKDELRLMLVSLYAAEKKQNVSYVLYDRFKNREIELPEEIYAFLFRDEEKKKRAFWRLLTENPRGGKNREFEKGLEDCLSYLESIMEIDSERD